MAELAVAAALVSAYGTIQQGKATDAMYKAQADQTLVQARSQVLQSRQQELAHREDGIKVLEQMKRNAATINARAAAGTLDPFSGSIGNLMTVNLDQGFQDFTMTRDNRFIAQQNQIIIQKSAEHQAAQYRTAGKAAKRGAMLSAVTQVAMAGATYGMMGGPGGEYSLFGGGAGGAPTPLLASTGGARGFSAPATRPTSLPGLY
jgi:hypothetical protein